VIIVVAVSSFQLYEFDSEPTHQLTLDKTFNKNMEARCEYRCLTVHHDLYQNYTVKSGSYNATFFMVNIAGFGSKSIMQRYYSSRVLGFPTMYLYLTNYNTTGKYTSTSFEITNVVGKVVNETCGNCTANKWRVCNCTSNYTFFENDGYHHVYLKGLQFTSFMNYNYRYLHIPQYSKIHFPYRPINFTLYYSVTLVPIFHYHNVFTGYFTGKPITLVYDPDVLYTTLIPYYNYSTK